MAKKEEAPKIVLERTYNVPLRREFQKAANWCRTKKASKALREFISKHMKSEDVSISNYVNQYLWKHGIKNPPHHVKVNAVKDEKGKVKVELVELSGKAKREIKKTEELEKGAKDKEEKKEEQKAAEEKIAADEKKKEKTEEAKKEEKVKEQEKEGLKELKKELPKQQSPKQAPQPRQVEQRPTAPKSQ